MGAYKACSPLNNGNLIVNCCSVQQMTTLLNCTHLTDGVVAVEATASPHKPIGARSAMARVSEAPPEISRGAPHTLLAYYYELQ